LTVEEYYEAVRAMGLRPTNAPTIFHDPKGNIIRVPLPPKMTSNQMVETLERIRENVRRYPPN
jgi:hypothetical protein